MGRGLPAGYKSSSALCWVLCRTRLGISKARPLAAELEKVIEGTGEQSFLQVPYWRICLEHIF